MAKKPWVCGISTTPHNGSACLLHGDELVVAVQEERLSRKKRAPLDIDGGHLAIDYCLQVAGIRMEDLDMIADCVWGVDADPQQRWGTSKLGQRAKRVPYFPVSHHLGHAASVAFTSGFESAAVLVIDGSGSPGSSLEAHQRDAVLDFADDKFENLSIYSWSDGELRPVEKHMSLMPYLRSIRQGGMPAFASLGHMFSSVALQIFGHYLEAGKVMGLAPYGKAHLDPDQFFDIKDGRLEYRDTVPARYRENERWPHRQEEYQNLAASTQQALEAALDHVAGRIHALGLRERLCYTGGVALNSVANHKVFAAKFRDLFILPAAEDSGPAIGAAFLGLTQLQSPRATQAPRSRARLQSDFLGRSYSRGEIVEAIEKLPGLEVHTPRDVEREAASLLSSGKILGWFDGGAEFGPRALGHRSILCDPRRIDGKEVLNSRVKHRESFRPFAPVIMKEHVAEWFQVEVPTHCMEFMLEVCRFREPLTVELPAVVHVDGTGRLQVLSKQHDPRLHTVIQRFYEQTGVPILVNTSFNIMGEPVVESPYDALWCLLYTGIDSVVFGDGLIVSKSVHYQGVDELIPTRATTVRRDERGVPYFETSTLHGTVRHGDLAPDVLAFFELCDGESTVRELCTQNGADGKRLLGTLMRMHAVTVRMRK